MPDRATAVARLLAGRVQPRTGWKPAKTQATALQRLLMSRAKQTDGTQAGVAACARAWEILERLKRELKGQPLVRGNGSVADRRNGTSLRAAARASSAGESEPVEPLRSARAVEILPVADAAIAADRASEPQPQPQPAASLAPSVPVIDADPACDI